MLKDSLMYNKIIKALYESKCGTVNESYATVKDRFIRDGADKSEVKSILDLHKKLKDMKRLKTDDINIDVLAKGKTFDDFKSLMSRYSEKDTATKKDKFNELKNKIVAENDEWTVYKIDTAEEAYLFHGLTKWCIVSGSKSDAEEYFDLYTLERNSNFYFIVRKNPIDDKWDYIALQLQKNKKTFWDKNDSDHQSLPRSLNIPNLNFKFEPVSLTNRKSWKLNSDGTYDVVGTVNFDNYNLDDSNRFIKDGKLTIKFNKVTGNFWCGHNQLTSLEGCPKEVGGDFHCDNNKLSSLEGGPEKVGGDFYCHYNELTSLNGCPKEIGGDFDCYTNKLTTLKGAPKKVDGSFDCSGNELTSLIGCPEKVDKKFDCGGNDLSSLEGCPKVVGGWFFCRNNKGKQFTKSDIEEMCKVGGKIIV